MVKLSELFAPLEDCLRESVWLYGWQVMVYYQCFQFHWDKANYPEIFPAQVARKVEAFERFIHLNGIALGVIQVLALEMPQSVNSKLI